MQDVLNAFRLVGAGYYVWLALTCALGLLVYRLSGSIKRGVWTTVILFLVTTWDLIPGLTMFSKYSRELAGARIFKTVEAEGYLDMTLPSRTFISSIQRARSEIPPYQYVEVYSSGEQTSERTLFGPTGYWEIRKGVSGTAECAPFEALKNFNRLREYYRIEECPVVTHRDEPISRYVVEDSYGFKPLPGWPFVKPVHARYQKIVDRLSGDVLAQQYAITFASWMVSSENAIGFLNWGANSRPGESRIPLRIEEVIVPINRNREAEGRNFSANALQLNWYPWS